MQGRVVELIGKVNLDEFTAELLRINDELNNLFLRYARYEKNRDPKAASTPSAILGQALGQPDLTKDSLIDLGGGEEAAVGGVSSQFAGLGKILYSHPCP
jgi:GAT domain